MNDAVSLLHHLFRKNVLLFKEVMFLEHIVQLTLCDWEGPLSIIRVPLFRGRMAKSHYRFTVRQRHHQHDGPTANVNLVRRVIGQRLVNCWDNAVIDAVASMMGFMQRLVFCDVVLADRVNPVCTNDDVGRVY